jgi:hypothetical protein
MNIAMCLPFSLSCTVQKHWQWPLLHGPETSEAYCEKSLSDSVLGPLRFPLCIVKGHSPIYMGLSGISLPWHIIGGGCTRRCNYPFTHTLLSAGSLFPVGEVGSCCPWPSDFRSCPGNIDTTCLNFSEYLRYIYWGL